MKSKTFIIDSKSTLRMAIKTAWATFVLGEKFMIVMKNVENVRKDAQNNLSHLWYNFISKEKGDETVKEIRAFCKLTIGVPIRNEEDDFREVYYRVIRPHRYEDKLEMMVEPIDFPVTRNMSVKQMTQYLNEIDRVFAEQGIILPKNDDNYYAAMGVKR